MGVFQESVRPNHVLINEYRRGQVAAKRPRPALTDCFPICPSTTWTHAKSVSLPGNSAAHGRTSLLPTRSHSQHRWKDSKPVFALIRALTKECRHAGTAGSHSISPVICWPGSSGVMAFYKELKDANQANGCVFLCTHDRIRRARACLVSYIYISLFLILFREAMNVYLPRRSLLLFTGI